MVLSHRAHAVLKATPTLLTPSHLPCGTYSLLPATYQPLPTTHQAHAAFKKGLSSGGMQLAERYTEDADEEGGEEEARACVA